MELGIGDEAFWRMDVVFFLQLVRESASRAQQMAEARKQMLKLMG